MRKLSFSLLVLFTLCSILRAQTEQSPWATLEPEGAGFSVLFPGKTVEAIDKKTSFTLHSFTVTLGRATYVASYSDYEPGKLDAQKALMANRDKFNRSLQATLTSSREITVGGHTGIEFTSETPAANLKSQLFLVGNRMYQTATFVFRDADETRNVDRFFESFKFTEKVAPKENFLTQRRKGGKEIRLETRQRFEPFASLRERSSRYQTI